MLIGDSPSSSKAKAETQGRVEAETMEKSYVLFAWLCFLFGLVHLSAGAPHTVD